MKLYKFSMLLIFLLIVAVAAVTTIQVLDNNGAFKGSKFADSSIDFFYGFLIVFLLVSFCVVQIICLFTRKLTFGNLGFFILHAGLVLFLIGSFIFKMVGISEIRDMPVDGLTYSQIGIHHDNYVERIDLGFFIGVKNFRVDKYDPIYDLYKKKDSGKFQRVMHDVEPDDNGVINFKEYGQLDENAFDQLVESENVYKWSEDLYVLKRQPDKYYEADLIVHDLSGENKKDVKLVTNKPYRRKGWIIYLMSYSPDKSSIKVLFKYDPAEIISQVGLWMIITGSFVMCFLGKTLKKVGRKNG